MRTLFSLIVALVLAFNCNADSNADVINAKVERVIDLTSHLVRIVSHITVENKGQSELKSYTYAVEPLYANNVAFVGAQVEDKNAEEDENKLKVTELKGSDKGALYKIDFKKPVPSGKTQKFDVEVVIINAQTPYPKEITQNDKQLMLFKGSSHYYTLYTTVTQTTKVNLASERVESFTQNKPTSKSDQTITYGPYENVQKPFEFNEIQIHYENNSPFLTVSQMTRTIEISHWGNIAVEETIDLYHSGAKLKGSFSRFEYMRRQGGAASVKSYKTLLPAAANSVYYRDEIGNISTSNLRYTSEAAELELRPRFPLFGGWKTHYTVGYNIPSYTNLFNKGSNYLLKMKFIDHVYDDQLIEQLTVKIILPEHSSDIKFSVPFDVTRDKDQLHYTYLDTVGRPVIVLRKKNVVDNHVEDFELKYTFQKHMILKEPFIVAAAFYLFFTFVIILVRFDFSLTKDAAQDAKLKVKAYWDQVRKYQDKRESLYESFLENIEEYKKSKGGKPTLDKRKKLEADLKQVAGEIDSFAAKIKGESEVTSEKIGQVNQADAQAYEIYQKLFELAQKLVNGGAKDEYVNERNKLDTKLKQIKEKVTSSIDSHL